MWREVVPSRLSVLLALSFALLPAPMSAQDLPLFDAHIHYNQPDWSVYTPEAILGLLDKTGVRWAIVSSTPDQGTIRLYERAPSRIVPVLRPYRTRADMGTWTTDTSILPYVQDRLKRGIYKGLGEFHLSAAQAKDPVVKEFAALAARLAASPTNDCGFVIADCGLKKPQRGPVPRSSP